MPALIRVLPIAAALAACLSVAPRAAADAARDARAASLHREALAHAARNTIESRRLAIDALVRATLLRPDQPAWELDLARLYLQCGFRRLARERFERVASLAPDDADARLGLAWVWRRDWLKFLDRSSLERAIAHLTHAVRARPERGDAWLALVPLLVEKGELRAASAAARRAREADPDRLEPRLADAYTAWRLGRVAEAERLFEATVPRLPAELRERFEDISPLASERDTFELRRLPSAAARDDFVRRFWRAQDPDLATPENEARLEYLARVAHAFFLFWDARRGAWDERGEVYVRYGPPASADYNPLGERLSFAFGVGPDYPVNLLVWNYPELGMRVRMHDRTLDEFYSLPVSRDADPDPLPALDSVRLADGRMAARSGRAVFPVLPPRTTPMPLAGALARFEGERSGRVLGHFAVPAGPGDTLWAEWVVLDSARSEVARAGRRMSPSACDPTGLQVADFAAEVRPGEYLIGVSVRDGLGRRGVYRAEVRVRAARPGLRVSDVVLACGPPLALAGAERGPAVRIEPNPGARVAGDAPLTAYFEIDGLARGADGRARFETSYTVRSAERDPRIWIQRILDPRSRIAPLNVTREGEHAGPLRRQFVTVPVQGLPAGRYVLEVRVRDLVSGDEASAAAAFVREAAAGRP
uniref:GWxTD domain-containing protein n=1 Tax=Eiseniibacteriota bacterium TaxID=2212470 RepID=A0A832I9U5_UNCEI